MRKNIHIWSSRKTCEKSTSIYTFAYIASCFGNAFRKNTMIQSMTDSMCLAFGWWPVSARKIGCMSPPRQNDAMLSLNIDTYVDYVDKLLIRRNVIPIDAK